MNTDNTDSANNEVVSDAVTGRKQTKQFPIVCFEVDKETIQELKTEYSLKCDQEAVRMVLTVATNHRFDAEGNDRFQAAAQAIIDGREGGKKKKTQESALQSLLDSGMTIEQIQAFFAAAKA